MGGLQGLIHQGESHEGSRAPTNKKKYFRENAELRLTKSKKTTYNKAYMGRRKATAETFFAAKTTAKHSLPSIERKSRAHQSNDILTRRQNFPAAGYTHHELRDAFHAAGFTFSKARETFQVLGRGLSERCGTFMALGFVHSKSRYAFPVAGYDISERRDAFPPRGRTLHERRDILPAAGFFYSACRGTSQLSGRVYSERLNALR